MVNLHPGLGAYHGAYRQAVGSICGSDPVAATVLVDIGKLVGLPSPSLWEIAGTQLKPTDHKVEVDEWRYARERGHCADGYILMGLHTLQTLIVDDHPFMRQLLGDMVRAAGLRQPVTADNGEQAIGLLMAMEIDLLLIDLEMPAMSGLEVARWVRSSPQSRWRALPIIMITAHTGQSHVERARWAAAGLVDTHLS